MSKGLSNSARKPFGENAEMYLANLFDAERIKDNSNLPDLKIPETNILIEAKSSKKPKVDIVIDQMEYYLRGDEEFQRLCDKFQPRQPTLGLFHEEIDSSQKSIYYSIIKRNDELGEADILQDLSGTALNWQEQFIIPAQLVWTLFHLDYSRKIRNPTTDEYRRVITPEQIKKERMQLLRNIASTKMSSDRKMYALREDLGRQSWQNITHNTLLSLFYNTNQGTTDISKWLRNRVPKYYEGFDALKKVELKGPSGAPIRMFIEPKDELDFENIEDRIRKNTPTIERIRDRRERFFENEISSTPVKLKSGRTLDIDNASEWYNNTPSSKKFPDSKYSILLKPRESNSPEVSSYEVIDKRTGEILTFNSIPRDMFDSDPNGIKRNYPTNLEHIVAACQWRDEF